MRTDAEHVLCRFHVSSRARHGLSPLFEWIVHQARGHGLRGATVLKGIHGMRADGALLEENAWTLGQDVPVIVEVVDEARQIEALLQVVEPALRQATVTLERARVLVYRPDGEIRATGRRLTDVDTPAASAAGEVRTMQVPENGVLLRIFIGESDRDRQSGRPLYETIVARAREAQLAGATVLKGPMGFGRHSRVHAAKVLELSRDLPVLVEIVDAKEKIDAFLPVVDELVGEGLVTLEAVRVLKYASPDRR